jgi:uncharacterized protein (UPF0548 family)
VRRSNFVDLPVNYAAVGATQAADLMQYPPEGFVPSESSIRLGSGEQRFHTAAAQLLTWGVQHASGITVSDIHVDEGAQYGGIRYAEDGSALEPIHAASEKRFGSDGSPYIAAGTTAHLRGSVDGAHVDARIRVVYVVEEPTRVAFAYGTVDAHPVSGEESFQLEHRDDDSVWFTVRAFTRPLTLTYRLLPVLDRRRRKRLTQAYLRSLSPAFPSAPPASAAQGS